MKTTHVDEMAREIIARAIKRTRSRKEVSAFYGIPPDIVERYLEGKDCGTLNGRKVIRVEIARTRALLEGNTHFIPSDKDRYKGTR